MGESGGKMQVDRRTLREFYPQPEVRHALHYKFVHRFLVQQVRANARAFFWTFLRPELPGAMVEPIVFINLQWSLFEDQMGLAPPRADVRTEEVTVRFVSDLGMTVVQTAGRPVALVQMPPPERQTQAHFIAVVLEASLQQPENWPADVTARIFTLEQPDAELSRGGRMGVMCEWTMVPRHRFLGRAVQTNLKAFTASVASLLQEAETPATAEYTPASSDKPPIIEVRQQQQPHLRKPWWQPW